MRYGMGSGLSNDAAREWDNGSTNVMTDQKFKAGRKLSSTRPHGFGYRSIARTASGWGREVRPRQVNCCQACSKMHTHTAPGSLALLDASQRRGRNSTNICPAALAQGTARRLSAEDGLSRAPTMSAGLRPTVSTRPASPCRPASACTRRRGLASLQLVAGNASRYDPVVDPEPFSVWSGALAMTGRVFTAPRGYRKA